MLVGYLFDKGTSSDSDVEPSHYLFDGTAFQRPMDLMYTSRIIVVLRHIQRSAHGVTYVEDDCFYCDCSLEGREQQAGMFSISGAEDKSPQSYGGLREVTVQQILAREWHGDIHSVVWIDGDMYDVDGAPEHRVHGKSHHWEIRVRRIADYSMLPESERRTPPTPNPDAPIWGENGGDAWQQLGSIKT